MPGAARAVRIASRCRRLLCAPPSSGTSRACERSMGGTSSVDRGRSPCRTRWSESCRAQRATGPGSVFRASVFRATRPLRDRETGDVPRHHLHETVPQRALREAAEHAGIARRVTCQALRHLVATQAPGSGYDIRTIQELLGHRDVSTTMIDKHVLNRGDHGVRPPRRSRRLGRLGAMTRYPSRARLRGCLARRLGEGRERPARCPFR